MRAVIGTALALLVAHPAHAQAPDGGAPHAPDGGAPHAPDVDPERAAEARRLFEQGIEYAEQERWGEALEYFRRSRAIVDRPSTTFNAAVALLRLGRPTEGLEALQDYLRMAGEGEEERRAEARRLLELALSSVAQVTLIVDPAHAEVRVDGDLAAGDEPTRTLTLDPGTHHVRVTAEGYEPASLELSLLDGERVQRTVALERDVTPTGPARVTVTSTVARGRIRIDGEEVGQGTWTGELDPGRHRIEVRAEDHEPFRRAVDLSPGQRLDVQAALTPIEQGSLLEEPWLWIVAGAVAVATAVTAGILLTSGTDDPYPGTTGVVLQGLRW